MDALQYVEYGCLPVCNMAVCQSVIWLFASLYEMFACYSECKSVLRKVPKKDLADLFGTKMSVQFLVLIPASNF